MKEDLKCKLFFKNGELIDDNVTCNWIEYGPRKEFSHILIGHGEIESSKPLPITQEEKDFKTACFDLVFDEPIIDDETKVPIVIQDSDERWASFNTGELGKE